MTSTPIPNCPQPETPIRERAWADGQRPEPKYSDAEIMSEWFKADGSVHGPNVETVTMPRDKYLAFRRSLLASRPSTPDKAGVSDADDGYVAAITRHDRILLDGKFHSVDSVRAALTHFVSRSAEAVRDGEDVAEFEVHAGGEYFSTSCGQRDAAFADAMHYVSTLDSDDGTPEVFEVTRRKIEIKEQSHD